MRCRGEANRNGRSAERADNVTAPAGEVAGRVRPRLGQRADRDPAFAAAVLRVIVDPGYQTELIGGRVREDPRNGPGGGRSRRSVVLGRPWPMRGDDGSAVVEFVTLGLLLLLPLIYLVTATGRVQAATFAADSSARAAVRAFVLARSDDEGRAKARAAVRLGLRDQGFDDERSGRLELVCSADPCLTPGATVTATVTVDVMLPGVPAVVDGAVPAHVTVRSAQIAAVDEFRATS